MGLEISIHQDFYQITDFISYDLVLLHETSYLRSPVLCRHPCHIHIFLAFDTRYITSGRGWSRLARLDMTGFMNNFVYDP